MSDLEDEMDLVEDEFSKATKFIERNHSKFEQQDLLRFYGFFKQATSGKCDISKPGIFNLAGRAKWSAWYELGSLAKEEAMKGYVQHLSRLHPNWNGSHLEDDIKPEKSSWISVSTFASEKEEIDTQDKTIVDFIKEGNIPEVKQILFNIDAQTVINEKDEDGLGLLHWAADRGHTDILDILITVPKVNLNLQDSCGQTPLHYAASCGHFKCVELLVKAGADRSLQDNEGETCRDIAFDETIKELLK